MYISASLMLYPVFENVSVNSKCDVLMIKREIAIHFAFSFAVLQDEISITRSDVHLEESVLKA